MKILIIEDSRAVAAVMAARLSSLGHEVDVAENGAIGVDKFESGQPDLVFMDIEMPVMNGFQMIRAIRSDPTLRHLPVVIVTGLEDMESIDHAYDEGATSFVTKPVNWRLLSYQLRYVLRAQKVAAAA